MGWDRPILTDSGGYQVMSLSALTKQSEEGVSFRSHLDGSRHMLTPERSMEIQRLLGSDIVMAFDECPPNGVDAKRAEASMERSMRWAARSRAGFDAGEDHAARSALFGIQQGFARRKTARALGGGTHRHRFRRLCDRGLAVGEGQEAMFGVLDFAPANSPPTSRVT
jgi:queuine tRNA-ribosyltransferase